MVKIFLIVPIFIAWLVADAVFLIVGPLLWVPAIIRAATIYTGLMLLSAIANRGLGVPISILEDGITYFPRILYRSIEVLRINFNSTSLMSIDDLDVDSKEKTNSLAEIFSKGIGWVLFQLFPSALIWIPIIWIARILGADVQLSYLLRSPMETIVVWMAFWLIVGMVGIWLLPIVRFTILIPFVALVSAVWAVIGIVFWIPELAFGFSRYYFSLAQYVFSKRLNVEEFSTVSGEILTRAFFYYFTGFRIIWNVFSERERLKSVLKYPNVGSEKVDSDVTGGVEEGRSIQKPSGALELIAKPLYRRLWQLLLYPVILAIAILSGVLPLPQLSTSLGMIGSSFKIDHEVRAPESDGITQDISSLDGISVYIGPYSSFEKADLARQRAIGLFIDGDDNLDGIIQRVTVGDRVMYRAYIGGFETRTAASSFCGRWRAAGGTCLVRT